MFDINAVVVVWDVIFHLPRERFSDQLIADHENILSPVGAAQQIQGRNELMICTLVTGNLLVEQEMENSDPERVMSIRPIRQGGRFNG